MDNFTLSQSFSFPSRGSILAQEMFDSFTLRYNHQQQIPTSCMICYEEKPLSNITSCNHYFCYTCIKSYLEIKISESEVLNVTCPQCRYEIPEEKIKEYVSLELYSKYLKFIAIRRLERDVMVKWCPKPDCGGYDRAHSSNYNLTCNICAYRYCYVCSRLWHKGKCKLRNDLGFDLWTLTNNVKVCPNCKNYVQKNGGCLHMSCPRCLHHWCWICGGDFSSPSHTSFKCLIGRNIFDLYWVVIFLMLIFPLTTPFIVLLYVIYSYETETIDKENFNGILSCFKSRFIVYTLGFILSPIVEILGLVIGYFTLVVLFGTREFYGGGIVEALFRIIVSMMLGNVILVSMIALMALLVVLMPVLGCACLASKLVLSLVRCFGPQQAMQYPRLFG